MKDILMTVNLTILTHISYKKTIVNKKTKGAYCKPQTTHLSKYISMTSNAVRNIQPNPRPTRPPLIYKLRIS